MRPPATVLTAFCCRRNCKVNLDDLDWDRPDLDCEPQQARGIPRNLQLDEAAWAAKTVGVDNDRDHDPAEPV